VATTGGLRVLPQFAFADTLPIDLLVVPGGFGTRALMHDEDTLAWIRAVAAKARKVTSVCTGSLLLARAGLLEGRRATTHWGALDLLQGSNAFDRGRIDQRPRFEDLEAQAGQQREQSLAGEEAAGLGEAERAGHVQRRH